MFSSGGKEVQIKGKRGQRKKAMIFQYVINCRNLERQFGFITTTVHNFLWEFKFKNFSLVLFKFFFKHFCTIYTSRDSTSYFIGI